MRDFPDRAKYPDGWEEHKKEMASAPRWLERYNIPLIEEKPVLNIATPFQIINMDIFDERYHSRYLKFVEAFGRSGIPQMEEVKIAYLHNKSRTRGEEGSVPERGVAAERFAERMKAWARAFKGVEYKLCYVDHKGPHLKLAYKLGMGQRNGYVEMYMLHCDNPMLGQYLDNDGYLCVDESCPPIADNKRAFGDENEEYYKDLHVPRFGPYETFPHRYRESMLRVLQMRRNFLWTCPFTLNAPLLSFVSLELARTVHDLSLIHI